MPGETPLTLPEAIRRVCLDGDADGLRVIADKLREVFRGVLHLDVKILDGVELARAAQGQPGRLRLRITSPPVGIVDERGLTDMAVGVARALNEARDGGFLVATSDLGLVVKREDGATTFFGEVDAVVIGSEDALD